MTDLASELLFERSHEDTPLSKRLHDLSVRITEARARAAMLDARRSAASVTAQPARARHAAQLEEDLVAALAEVEGLRIAMASRAVIEQAKGMVMLRERCDAERAFAVLVAASQRSHRKLRDVAAAVVARESGHPPVDSPD